MVKVLVIGGTGFIGGAVVKSLRKQNHRVYGLARSPEKAKTLAKEEVIVIPGSTIDSAAYLKVFQEDGIDAVIDLSRDKIGSYKVLEDLAPLAENRLKTRGHKLGYIYVSGVWVHGTSNKPISDLDLIGDKAPTPSSDYVAWKSDFEAKILNSRNLFDVAIVRPAVVYGTTSGIWSYAFGPIYQAVKRGEADSDLTIEIDPEVAINLVHNDDTGDAIQLALEKLSVISGSGTHPIFDIVTSYEGLQLIVRRASKALGFTGNLNFVPPQKDNVYGKAFNTQVNTGSERAISLLGWQPTRHSMLSDAEVYATSWAASQE